jgi:ribosomal protein S18 acetylase RimI-like enzyme
LGFHDAGRFLERAERWLLESEAENNLILAIAERHRAAAPARDEPRVYLAAIVDDEEVCGCAFRTPPLKLGITRMPRQAIEPLVQEVHSVFPAIPGVLGPEPEAGLFAAGWGERTGTRSERGMRQGIYQLERVRPPKSYPPGRLRLARQQDLELAADWSSTFVRETHVDDRDIATSVRAKIEAGTLWLWDDGEPRSMAAEGGRTPNGSRVGWVFTPPELRGRGYASACVATLSENLLAAGRRFCFLYTDLANETSNALYQRIGYERVGEVIDYRFGDAH